MPTPRIVIYSLKIIEKGIVREVIRIFNDWSAGVGSSSIKFRHFLAVKHCMIWCCAVCKKALTKLKARKALGGKGRYSVKQARQVTAVIYTNLNRLELYNV